MPLEVNTLRDLREFKALSDAGYSAGEQFQLCKSAGIITYSGHLLTTAPSSNYIPTVEFIYNKGDDFYLCPATK